MRQFRAMHWNGRENRVFFCVSQHVVHTFVGES